MTRRELDRKLKQTEDATKAPVGLRLNRELMRRVRDAAKQDNRTVSNWIETALYAALENSRDLRIAAE